MKGYLGGGSCGTVFQVRDIRAPSRVLACKVMPIPDPGSKHEDLQYEFLNEVGVMRRLSSHSHIVKIVDAYLLDDIRFGT